MSADDDFAELERLMQLSKRFPQLARAITGSQTTFDIVAKPTDADLVFLTKVTDAPLQAEGRLGPDGLWRVSCYHLPAGPEHEAGVEDAVAKEANQEILILRDGSIAEAIIKDAIPKVVEQMPDNKARAVFERRLAASRFADGITIH
jgi:hypothetical protein